MADRPRNDGSGDGTPEFGWLYGKKPGGADPTRRVPGQQRDPRPDETRVMPVQPRGGQSTPPPAPPPQRPGPGPAPGPKPPGGGGSGLRRPRFRLRYVLLLLVAWIVFLVGVPIYAWTSVDKIEWEPSGERPDGQPGTTYLLVGSDSRDGLSKEERRKLAAGDHETNLADTIMLLHTGGGPNVLLSIPRDSLVDIPGSGRGKINGAFARGGAPLLTRTIEEATGIRIDHYVQIGLGGVPGVVDAVGGVEVCPKKAIRDPAAGLRIKRGCQTVDGTKALAYARSRKTSTFGDLDRVQRQREVVGAVGKKVLSPWTVLNPVRYWRLNNAVPGFFSFGEGTNVARAGMMAMALTSVGGEGSRTCTMPITDGSANNWDMDRAQPIFDAFKDDSTDDITNEQCTPTGLPRSVTG